MNGTRDEPESASLMQVGKNSYVLYVRLEDGKMVLVGTFSVAEERLNGIWRENE